ncbi:MAG: hypothetical protein KC964_23585 [Candidatus Omnitrophica bacterium]|nr:hypothetical protein [Candidatus Omnitrophota bacterium]
MDKKTLSETTDFLEAAFAPWRKLGVRWSPLPENTRGNQRVQLQCNDHEVDYSVEIKRNIRPSTLGATIHGLRGHSGKVLLLTDYVTPALAEDLRERGVEFLDLAGNAFLQSPPLLVWVKGQRPKDTGLTAASETGREFQPSGLKVLFTLLCNPGWVNLSYRDLAQKAGVAHGTIGWVMLGLERLRYVSKSGRRRRLLEPRKLLDAWVEAYARTLRPKVLLGRYNSDDLDWVKEFDGGEERLLLSGEPAGSRLTGYLRPGTATIYGGNNVARSKLIVDHKLQPDRNGNVEFLRQFWNFEGEDPSLTPTVMIYADLLALGHARCIETAGVLYDEYIANRFETL